MDRKLPSVRERSCMNSRIAKAAQRIMVRTERNLKLSLKIRLRAQARQTAQQKQP